MARFKIIMLSMLAVFAFSAVIASTASAHRVWTVCEEKAGAGTEPPTKFDNHECNTKVKPLAERKWEDIVLPVGQTRKLEVVKVVKEFVLKAGGEEIACEAVTLSGGTIENIAGPTGRDKGTITFSKNCRNLKKAACKVTEPIEVKGKETALVENTEKNRVYDLFAPKGWTEEKPEEFGLEFATIKQTGEGCVAATKVEGNGIAAEIVPEGLSVTKVLKFPCPPIKEIINWKGTTVKLKLTAFGVKTEECGEVELALESKWAWDVQ
jgi:hypothetical protein